MSELISSRYNPLYRYEDLKELGLTSCEIDVFREIVDLNQLFKQVYICLVDFAEKLGYARGSICRAVSSLTKKGFIRKTGEKYLGFFSFVEILILKPDSLGLTLNTMAMIFDIDVSDIKNYREAQEIELNEIKQTEIVNQYLKDLGFGAGERQRN